MFLSHVLAALIFTLVLNGADIVGTDGLSIIRHFYVQQSRLPNSGMAIPSRRRPSFYPKLASKTPGRCEVN
jgi:hypothetical protein